MRPIKAQWVNPTGTRVRVEYDNSAVSEFPTNEVAYPPWIEVMGYVARGELVIEPYHQSAALSAEELAEIK